MIALAEEYKFWIGRHFIFPQGTAWKRSLDLHRIDSSITNWHHNLISSIQWAWNIEHWCLTSRVMPCSLENMDRVVNTRVSNVNITESDLTARQNVRNPQNRNRAQSKSARPTTGHTCQHKSIHYLHFT